MGRDEAGSAPEKVFLLRYDHKHGTDLSAYLTEDDAEVGAAHLMLEWISYLCDGEDSTVADEIVDHIEKGEYVQAMGTWPTLAGDTEFISIEEVKLYPDPPKVDDEDIENVREQIAPAGDDVG
jgi:hypothetical protein